MHKSYLNWSSGKDSALSLYFINKQSNYRVEKLFTTINKEVNRVSMHGLRKELLIQQAENIGLPIFISELTTEAGIEEYNLEMGKMVNSLSSEGFTHSIFGDIFLEDLKNYREDQLRRTGITPVFPLWKMNTRELITDFIDIGFKAIVVCTNSKYLDESFCGRIIDHEFLKDLPDTVDPCGENGEFHTFVYDGPIFKNPVDFSIGGKVNKSYKPAANTDDNCFQDELESWDTEFCYCDLIAK